MAPTAPKPEKKLPARAHRHARLTGAIHPLAPSKLFRPEATTSDDFITSKSDKRMIKHSQFLSRVQSSASKISKPSSSKSRSGHRRNRRPGNKIASLQGLEDALPEVEEKLEEGKVRHRSLKSRPGAIKRKEKIVKGEMDRFGVNMAQLAKAPADEPSTATQGNKTDDETSKVEESGQGSRWAALRGYISATMEQNPAFGTKS